MSGRRQGSDWTVDTAREYLAQRLEDQQAAFQLQLDQRFTAAETAVTAALEAAEKAVVKAEVASDKRFEAVNEFRKALTDQTAGFIPRAEYDAQNKSLTSKQEEQARITAERVAALELRLTSRLDLTQGQSAGAADYRTERRLDIGLALQTAAIIATMIGLVIVAFHK